MQSYNVFCLKSVSGLCCAVPECRAVPSFLSARNWAFSGRLSDEAEAPADFDERAATTAVRFNGFYLFETMDRRFN
ncbi:hypothetical protein IPV08_21075 [Methylobacterium sp. SD274]|jgi:hypothetical protein|uniref:hypothetical protein n=1 Tax=unclassified Methylobacterium TaxID=2615210 RepID=UPI001A965B82|nr:hypothetical protein [Methylobacterium sp. SD274]MBO1022460.1 hypothetical protein [Methylobacterium sp. SD274]